MQQYLTICLIYYTFNQFKNPYNINKKEKFMVKLKKTLGPINTNEAKLMMQLISSQNQHTLASWAINYAVDNYLPICYQEDILTLIMTCKNANENKQLLNDAKKAIKQLRLLAKNNDLIKETAIKAIATACATLTTPSNAFGFLLYGNAALAYKQLGLFDTPKNYEAFALASLNHAYQSLLKNSIPNEPDPVKINWNC